MTGPRSWTMPVQPPDVCVVIGKLTGHRWELAEDGDWYDMDDSGEYCDWRDLLADEGELHEVIP